jgi:hypothetical protein
MAPALPAVPMTAIPGHGAIKDLIITTYGQHVPEGWAEMTSFAWVACQRTFISATTTGKLGVNLLRCETFQASPNGVSRLRLT